MISIVIASVNENHLADIKTNIAATIGVAYEIIDFENNEGKVGLCELYNRGASQAKFSIICYMHEDIKISTYDWGKTIVNAFDKNENLGIIGIAGGVYKAISPSGWHSVSEITERSHIIQQFKFSDQEDLHHNINPYQEEAALIACVDGVWFCTLKEIVKAHPFDDKLFKGFHGYDIDFSLQVGQKYEITVRYDILITHFSEGNFNLTWVGEILKLHQKWNRSLPISKVSLDKKTQLLIEKRTFKRFIDDAIANGITKRTLYGALWAKNGIRKINLLLFLQLNRYLLKK
ncbi:MAG: hypothetical protein EOP00_24630 [Pedobacter sp.]|nr:MAG: hypothetical protein EOP00_24630 [Pedobacter sp.]